MIDNTEQNMNQIQHEQITLLPNIPFKIYLSNQYPKVSDGSYIVPHYHDDLEIIYLLDGNVTIFENNKITKLHPNQLYVVNSNAIHSTTSDSKHIKNYVLQISYDFLIKFIPDFSKYNFSINQSDDSCKNLRSDIIKISKMMTTLQKNNYLSAISSLFDLIFLLATKHYTIMSSQSIEKRFKYHQRMSLIINYIENNYADPISLQSICNQVHLSPAYFSNFFKIQTGINFYTYLTNVRMNHAEKSLHNSNLEIMKIMTDCGFANYHQFRKEFYKRYHMSPSNYRKNIIKTI